MSKVDFRIGRPARVRVQSFVSGDDRCRAEFAPEVRTDVILSRMMRGERLRLPDAADYGEVDFSMDLHGVYAAARRGEEAWKRMPPSVKERYRSWRELLAASPKELDELLKAGRKKIADEMIDQQFAVRPKDEVSSKEDTGKVADKVGAQ